MADNIMDIGPVDQTVGYGGVGSAEFYGLKKEMLQRAALDRQARLDEEKRAADALAAEATRANMASLAEQRKGQAMLNQEKTQQMQRAAFAQANGVGDPLTTPESQRTAALLFGPSAVTPGQEATPEMPAQGPVNPADVAAGVDTLGGPLAAQAQEATPATFAGTEEQQQKKSMQDIAHGILNGDYDSGDPAENEQLRGWALSTLMTGKATNFPGQMHPKSQTEKDSTRAYNALVAAELHAKDATQPAPSAEDTAFAKYWLQHNATQAQKDAFRVNFQLTGEKFQTGERTSRELFAVKQKIRQNIAENEKNADKDIERSDRALYLLNSPNFVTDAVAGPEFLQITAGGMGSGLRMTDAELRRINEAQTKIDQFKGELTKWADLGLGPRTTIQNEMRAQMKAALEAVHAARLRMSTENHDALLDVEDVKSAGEADKLQSEYWTGRRAASSMANADKSAAKPAPAKSRYKVTVE